MDLFTLPDFLEDNDDDDDYELPVRRRRRGKTVPPLVDNEDKEDEDKVDDDNEEDEDYEVDEENNNDKQHDDDENDDEEDDEEITLQTGKAEQRKRKRPTSHADMVERRTTGQCCAYVDQATEFRKYIRHLMKTFEEHVRKGKQVKKYLLKMIGDVREVCMNMQYPGMDFDPEEIVPTISDLSFKAWQAMLS